MIRDELRSLIWEWMKIQDSDSCLIKAVFNPNYVVEYKGQMDIGMLAQYIIERWK